MRSSAARRRGDPMIERRDLTRALACVLAVAPFGAYAQVVGKPRRIVYLALYPQSPASLTFKAAFHAGMHELGYVEQRDYTLERFDAGGKAEQVPALVASVIASGVDLLLTPTTQLAAAAKSATA